ncbi:MAG: hypothetical protein AB9903_36280 [Vulcanimicrobiota bacterium]
MKKRKSNVYIFFTLLLSIIALLFVMNVSSARTCDDDGEIKVTRNSKPILSKELMPGFKLESSEIHQDKKTKEIIIAEYWYSTDGTVVRIDLYQCKSHKGALATAENIFYATMDDNQEPGGGKPKLGSWSGQTIGDVCWAYIAVGLPEERLKNDLSRGLVFIKGKSLVYLLVTNNVTKSVSVNLAEDIAKKIVSRIK